MDWQIAFIVIIGTLLALMFLGLPVAFSMLATGAIGAFIWWNGPSGLHQILIGLLESLTTFTLLAIPFFTLMGELLFHSGIAIKMLDSMDKWLGRLPGRLSLLAIVVGALLSTLTGVGTATIAVLGSELAPEMEKRGYDKSMSLGPILGSSGLAIMIPPSGLAVLLAAVGRISVAELLIAIIVPGVLMAVFYSAYIIIRCVSNPSIAPPYSPPPTNWFNIILDTVVHVLPVGIVIFLVTGVIFLGIATPSESAATGVVGVLILVTLYGKLSWGVLKKAFVGTTKITAMIFLIIAAAGIFGQILAFSGITHGIVEFVVDLPIAPIGVVCCIVIVMIGLGMLVPVIAMMVIILPILLPIIQAFGYSPVWFGTLMLLTLEMSVVSPPYGIDLFVMKQVAPRGTTIKDVYRSVIPFLCCDTIVLVLMIFFPKIVLWLPELMR